MPSVIGQITRKAHRDTKKLNILTIPCHETWESAISLTRHNFYALEIEGCKKWNEIFRPLPSNYIPLKEGLFEELDFDIVISHQKFGQFQTLAPIAHQYKIPLISAEHTAPVPSWPKARLKQLYDMQGDLNVFITDWSRKAWGWEKEEADVIYHGIDSELYKPHSTITRQPFILSVVNQFSKPVRHWCCGFPLWKEAIQGLPWRHLGADDEPFSQPAKNLQDLILRYQSAQIFINTSLVSPVPMALLEAASCGCAIITTGTSDIPNIFTHGENCLMSNDAKELHDFGELLLKDSELREKLGAAARKLVQERFPMDKFVNNWNKLFEKAIASWY
jgi:glycosyltransferase involved in cell wall biosynthesis